GDIAVGTVPSLPGIEFDAGGDVQVGGVEVFGQGEFQVISELKAGGLGNQEKVQVLSFRALVQGEHDRAVQADRRVLQGQLQALHDQLAEAGEGNLFVDKLFQPATDGIAGIIVLEPTVVLAGLAVKGFAQAVEQGFRVGADPMGFATQLEGDFAVFL